MNWRHNYQASISRAVETSDRTLIIRRADGSLQRFNYWRSSTTRYEPTVPNGAILRKSPVASAEDYWHYYGKDGQLEIYGDDGKLYKIQHPQGYSHTLEYTEGRLSSVTDSRGRALIFQYDNELLTAIEQPDGQLIQYEYDESNGNLTKVTFPDGDSDDTNNEFVTYHYEDERHPLNLTSKKDSLGFTLGAWKYDDTGRAVESSKALDTEVTRFAYEEARTIVTKDNGYERILHYQDGRLVSVEGMTCDSDNNKGTKSFAYNQTGLRLTTHENGRADAFSKDSRGLQNYSNQNSGGQSGETYTVRTTYESMFALPKEININGRRFTRYHYLPSGQLSSIDYVASGGLQRTTSFTYTANGLLHTVDGPRIDKSDVTTYEYYPNGDIKKIINALGQETVFDVYDANGRVTQVTDSNGNVTQYSYDARGRIVTITTPNTIFENTYDQRGLLVETFDGMVRLSYEYDAAANLTKISDAQQASVTFQYDDYNNLISQTKFDAANIMTYHLQQTIDAYERVISQLDANGHQTQFRYSIDGELSEVVQPTTTSYVTMRDHFSRIKKVTDPLLAETSSTYNSFHELTHVQDANGRITQYVRNYFGDVITLKSPDTGESSFTYDEAGNLLTMTDARGIQTTYQYDALNRIIAIGYPDASENLVFEYDNSTPGDNGIGRVFKVTGSTFSYEYTYDEEGNIAQRKFTNQGQLSHIAMTYEHGRLATLTYPSGNTLYYQYINGKPSGVELNVASSGLQTSLLSNISYLPFGPMKNATYGNGLQLTYDYNLQYSLTDKAVSSVMDYTYQYGPLNNITSITDEVNAASSQSFTYDDVSRLLSAHSSYGDIDYSYDPIGNRLSKTLNSNPIEQYVYTGGRLMQAGTTTLQYDANGSTIQKDGQVFAYNQANRLSTANTPSGMFTYVYDHDGRRIHKSSESISLQYIYAPDGKVLAELDANGNTTTEYYYLNDKRIALSVNDNIVYLHTSHLDYPVAMTNSGGAVVWRASHTPFGQMTIEYDALPFEMTARFPGQYQDQESGLFQNYFRDYDPELGRYIQSDPIGLAGGVNTYLYGMGNPVKYTDPYGLYVFGYNVGGGITIGKGHVSGSLTLATDHNGGVILTGNLDYGWGSPGAGGFARGLWGGENATIDDLQGPGFSTSLSNGIFSGGLTLPFTVDQCYPGRLNGIGNTIYEFGLATPGPMQATITGNYATTLIRVENNPLAAIGRKLGGKIYDWIH